MAVSYACKLCDEAGDLKQAFIVDGAGYRLRQDERVMAIVIDWLASQCWDKRS